MQATDARLLRDTAVPTAVVGVLAVVVSTVMVGLKGFTGSVIGAVIVFLFFGSSLVIISRVAAKAPMLLMNVALATYVGKLIVLAVFMIVFKHTTLFNFRAFGFTILAMTLVWLGAEARAVWQTKLFYVDTDLPTGLVKKAKPVTAFADSETESTAESEPSTLSGGR